MQWLTNPKFSKMAFQSVNYVFVNTQIQLPNVPRYPFYFDLSTENYDLIISPLMAILDNRISSKYNWFFLLISNKNSMLNKAIKVLYKHRLQHFLVSCKQLKALKQLTTL